MNAAEYREYLATEHPKSLPAWDAGLTSSLDEWAANPHRTAMNAALNVMAGWMREAIETMSDPAADDRGLGGFGLLPAGLTTPPDSPL